MTPEQIKEKFPIGSKWRFNDKWEGDYILAHTPFGSIVTCDDEDNVSGWTYIEFEEVFTPYTEPKTIVGYVNVYDDALGGLCFGVCYETLRSAKKIFISPDNSSPENNNNRRCANCGGGGVMETFKDLILFVMGFLFVIYMLIGFGIGITWPLWWEW
jgi:hypothetical protein